MLSGLLLAYVFVGLLTAARQTAAMLDAVDEIGGDAHPAIKASAVVSGLVGATFTWPVSLIAVLIARRGVPP